MTAATSNRFYTLDALRGLAALAVAWFHFTRPTPQFESAGFLELSGRYGYLGVEVFFVISGFIIPYTLWRMGYTLGDYKIFVLKRIIRLDPPYLGSILLVIGLAYLSAGTPGFRGAPPSYTLPQVLAHLGYVNLFFGYPWVNLVFWTLAIEFQYYLLIGLVFPVLVHRLAKVRWAGCAALGGAAVLFPQGEFVFSWLFLFLLGIFIFYYKTGMIGVRCFLALLAAGTAGTLYTHGAIPAGTCLVAALVIAFAEINSAVLTFLGEISFSVYLLHVPIGGRVVNLGMRLSDSLTGKCLSLLGAVAATICAAYVFYRFLEQPAQRWSSRIKFSKRREVGEPVVACLANSSDS